LGWGVKNAKINEFLSTFKINLFPMIPDGKKQKTKKTGAFSKNETHPLKTKCPHERPIHFPSHASL
jgi:hypothetical protein